MSIRFFLVWALVVPHCLCGMNGGGLLPSPGKIPSGNVLLPAQKNPKTVGQNQTLQEQAYQELIAGIVNNDLASVTRVIRTRRAPIDRYHYDQAREESKTPLMLAAKLNRSQMIKILLEAGASPDLSNRPQHMTPLMSAIVHRNKDVVQLFLEQKKNQLSARDAEGKTPFILAAKMGDVPIINILLQAHASCSDKDNTGMTPFLWAVFNKKPEAVRYLLNWSNRHSFSCLDDRDNGGKDALICASLTGAEDIVDMLLEEKIPVDRYTRSGGTALTLASLKGWLSIVQKLVKAGADIGHIAENKKTSLMLASQKGHESIVTYLLQQKAEASYCNNKGESAFSLACTESIANCIWDKLTEEAKREEALRLQQRVKRSCSS